MEKIWLKNYQAGVPAEIDPTQYGSLNEMFDEACTKYKALPAFASQGTTISFRDLEEQSRYFANFLKTELKLKIGDRFAIMMPNILQYPICMFGALRAGLAVVNVNPLFTARELHQQLKDADCQGIIILENFAHTLEHVLTELSIPHVIVTKIGDCFSFPKSLLANFVLKYIKKIGKKWSIPHFIPYKKAIQMGSQTAFHPPIVGPDNIAFLQYTGGTTALAKGVILTHGNMVANAIQAVAWVKPNVRPGKEIVLTPLPLYHIFSLLGNCLTFVYYGGLNVLIANPRDIKNLIKTMSHYRFTAISAVNTLYNALLNHPKFAKLDFSALTIALGGGMALQVQVAERWKKLTGITLLQAYGLTEASPAVCVNPLNAKEFNGSIGLPISSTDISIRDDNDNELPIGASGELCVRGPQVMKGYWHREKETVETLKNGWLHTGDIAKIDEQGFVWIIDRKKDLIIVSGFNVYPNEVEEVISMLPEVAEVGVVGIQKELGEMVKAYIVKKKNSLSKEEVIEHCRQQLAGYKIPKEIEFCDELPKSSVGKILRKELKKLNAKNV